MLTNERVHTQAYAGLESATRRLPSLAAVLDSSPTNVWTAARQSAGKQAVASNEAALKAATDREAALKLAAIALEQQVSPLATRNASLAAENAGLGLKVKEQEKVMEFRRAASLPILARIARRAYTNAVRNVADTAAEAIPYIGIAVMLAVTALDLKDDCDNVRDVNELSRTHDGPPQDEGVVAE